MPKADLGEGRSLEAVVDELGELEAERSRRSSGWIDRVGPEPEDPF